MSPDVNRVYRSPRREEAAKQTRQLIRDAAARLFVEQGITATTMRQIAAEAGVAERTVYTAFPSKTALFREVVDVAIVGDELPVPVADRPEFTSPQTESDPRVAVRQLVDYGCVMLERAGDLLMASIMSAGADPDMREFDELGSTVMTKNMRDLAQAWQRNGLLREGMTVEEAAAVLYTLSSPHVHHLLCRRQGWSIDQYREWLVETLTVTLLRDAP